MSTGPTSARCNLRSMVEMLFLRNAHLHLCLTALMHTSDAQYGLHEMLTGWRKHSSEEGHVQLS